MNEALVGVYNLLQVDGLVDIMSEGGVLVERLVAFYYLICRSVGLHYASGEDAAGEIATIRYEVDVGIERALHLREALPNLGHMLMTERFVYAQVVVAPAEMRCRTGFLSCTRAARNGVNGNVVVDKFHGGGRQQTELYAGCEASRVSHMIGLGYLVAVDFWQAINIVVARLSQTEVLREVYYLYVGRYVVFLKELTALAVTETEEHNIHLIKRHIRREAHIRVAVKSFVNIRNRIAGVALAVGKHNLCLRMIYQ